MNELIMCDTLSIVGENQVLFAKNSDRDPNEAQVLDWQPRQTHVSGSQLQCTYINIPQVKQTWAVLLSRPFWMWGAEIGANEHGVVIGNEAVFTRKPMLKTGLTGMDLLRLALERASTAHEAVEVITTLLKTHGQGGGCGFENRNFTYHNSYMIADLTGTLLLETAGDQWVVESVKGARSISNGLTISGFAEKHSDWLKTTISACKTRRARTEKLAQNVVDLQGLATILRDHGGKEWPSYHWLNGTLNIPCMHGGAEIASSLTTNSWISLLGPNGVQHWVTASSSPCLSLFKPVSVTNPLDLKPIPTQIADDSLWWKHERLHRLVMRDPIRLGSEIIIERNALEAKWFAQPPESAKAFSEHLYRLDDWLERVESILCDVDDSRPKFVQRYWSKRERQAGLNFSKCVFV